MLRSSAIQCIGGRVATEELVLVVTVPDDPTARRKLCCAPGHCGVDLVHGSDVLVSERQLVEAHSEPCEVIVRIVEAGNDGRSTEIQAPPSREVSGIVAQRDDPALVHGQGVDRVEVAPGQETRSEVNRVDQHW
jgi:hypothetical protein